MGAMKAILRYDDDPSADDDGDGIPDEVQEVGEVLWKHMDMVYNLFSYYASLNGSLCELDLKSWTVLVEECRLASKRSKFCKLADFDRLFIEVDTMGKMEQRHLDEDSRDLP